MEDNLIVDLSFQFALEIIDFTVLLKREKHFELAHQLFKSGTSIGANVSEAQGAVSKPDFRNKMRISYKEAMETRYWLSLCEKSSHFPNPGQLPNKLGSIIRVLGKIIASSK